MPPKSAARRGRIAELSTIPGTLVFFELPRRVAATLNDLADVLGPRDAAIARELTKYFETVRRGRLPDLAAIVSAGPPPKGEIVVLVGPPGAEPPAENQDDLDARLGMALEAHSVKDAAAMVSAETGQPRRKVYARAVELSQREQ